MRTRSGDESPELVAEAVAVMDRRGFLGRMAALFAATVVAPTDLLWQPDPQAVAIVAPDAVTGLTQMTATILREIERRLGVSVPCATAIPQRIGDGIEGHVLNRQVTVEMDAFPLEIDKDGVNVQRYLVPAAAQLAHAMRGVRATGQMLLPFGGVEHACWVRGPSGLSLRGLVAYDIQDDRHRLRFDALIADAA